MCPIELYSSVLRRWIKRSFGLWQRLGFHVTPNHFYEPIPDTRFLSSDLWSRLSDLPGIDLRDRDQLALLAEFARDFGPEYNAFSQTATPCRWEYYTANGAFESVDGEVLYCMIRRFKPKRIFEIGSGYSTYVAAQAALANQRTYGEPCALIAFEPYPNEVLKRGFPGLADLVQARIQDVPLSTFDELEQNDILFIDSSHVLAIGSDVQYEYLDILPRLRPGVLIHAHDIFLPAEYPRHWVLREHRFWTEQYVLQAFLSFNNTFRVLWAGNYMALKHPAELKATFSSFRPGSVTPGSFWIVRDK